MDIEKHKDVQKICLQMKKQVERFREKDPKYDVLNNTLNILKKND